MKTEEITLTPIADYSEEFDGYLFCNASLGPNDEVCLLLSNEIPPLINGSFPPTVTVETYDYKVILIQDGVESIIHLKNQRWNYHFVQPFGEDHILLVCARSRHYDDGKVDENARVFDKHGNFIRSFCLGDGIGNMYVTSNKCIWTGYFDEGVFGNYGWDDPIGKVGLICWNDEGVILESHDQTGNHFISDCYALNVVSDDEVWFYYYTDFHIGVRKNGETTYAVPDIQGASAFAICQDKLLFNGGYGDHGTFYLLNQIGSRYRTSRKIKFIDPSGKLIQPIRTSNRSNTLLLQNGSETYVYKLQS